MGYREGVKGEKQGMRSRAGGGPGWVRPFKPR